MADDYRSVDEYIAAQPESAGPALASVRAAIRKAVPEAEESISYGIPAYKIRNKPLLYFAGWKRHYSLYPAPKELIAAFAEELAEYEIRGSTIRFPLALPVPRVLIGRIARFRANNKA